MITVQRGTYPPTFFGLTADDKDTIDGLVNMSTYLETDGQKRLFFYNKETQEWMLF